VALDIEPLIREALEDVFARTGLSPIYVDVDVNIEEM